MKALLGKLMHLIIGYGLSIEGMYEDTSCHCPKETS